MAWEDAQVNNFKAFNSTKKEMVDVGDTKKPNSPFWGKYPKA
jgi:hypothetical protein